MTPSRAAFGTLAERYLTSFAESEPVVIMDQGGCGEALAECVRRRFRREHFTVRAILPKDSTVRVEAVATGILGTYSTVDERGIAFDLASAGTLNVNGRSLSDAAVYDPSAMRLMQAALRLSDGLSASSFTEYRRVSELLQTQAPADVRLLGDPSVPSRTGRTSNRDAIAVWAPRLSGDAAAAFAIALADLHVPVLLVSATSPTHSLPAEWIAPPEAGEALSRALLIVDSDANGSESAVSLASWGVPLLADIDSGASEVVAGVHTYDRRSGGALLEAAVGALGAFRMPLVRAASVTPSRFEDLENGPLATIIIPTFDRPFLLDLALQSIARQTYRNIETIVVVDGGPRLDHLAERHPSVRFIHMERNDAVASCNTAFAQANGKYVTFLNDDDLFFPNHVAALVSALERSGLAVAHGDVLTAFLRGSDERWMVYGFESNMSRAVAPSALLASNQIGMTSCLFRRDALGDDPPFDEVVPLYRDYALWLRLSNEFDFLHVERITSCYTIRNAGNAQQSTLLYDKALGSYEVLYERYPANGRPVVAAKRREVLAAARAGQLGIAHAAPARDVTPALWPLW